MNQITVKNEKLQKIENDKKSNGRKYDSHGTEIY